MNAAVEYFATPMVKPESRVPAPTTTYDFTDWRDWLPAMMRNWANQFARNNNAGQLQRTAIGTETWHFDGWPLATVLGKIKIEAEGASQGQTSRNFAEVYSGDGFIIWRAMQGLRYAPRALLHVLYLSRGSWRDQATALGLSKTSYWEIRRDAHTYVSGRVPLLADQYTRLRNAQSEVIL